MPSCTAAPPLPLAGRAIAYDQLQPMVVASHNLSAGRPCERRDPSPLASKVTKGLCSSAETRVRAAAMSAIALTLGSLRSQGRLIENSICDSPGRGPDGPRLRHRAKPRSRRSARSSCSDVSASMRPITHRMPSRRSATSLSVMICDRRRRPFSGATSISGRSKSLSCKSDETGQTRIVERPASNSPP